jgi:hypothetical protein
MGGFRKEFHLFFVPRKSFLCEKALKVRFLFSFFPRCFIDRSYLLIYIFQQDLGVYGTFTNVDEFCLDLIPFDSDVLSMEMEMSYKVVICIQLVLLLIFFF